MRGAWIVYGITWVYSPLALFPDELEARQFANRQGYGEVAFWPWGEWDMRRATANPEDGGATKPAVSAPEQLDAADRIEALKAERDTLAEILGIISPHVEYDDEGRVGIVAGRNFHAHSRWTKSDAERFRAALDRVRDTNG